MTWKLAKAFMPGRIHRQAKKKSQDVVAWSPPTDNFICMAMADGAGSAAFARDGAIATTVAARDILCEAGAAIFEREPADIAQWLIDGIQQKLALKAEANHCEVSDYACTLLFFATDGKRLVCGNLGDGCVGCHNSPSDGSEPVSTVLLPPEHGQYKNESFFVTTPGIHSHLRILQTDFQPGSVYALMTDGTCDCILDNRTQTFAPAFATFAQWMRQYPHPKVEEALRSVMQRLFTQRTSDDCALALLTASEL